MKLKPTISISGTLIGRNTKPYVIAEIGSNFDQDLSVAKKLISESVMCGVNAVKFQLFSAKSLFPNMDGNYLDFKKVELNPNWIPELANYSKELGITFLCSVFDLNSLAVLENCNVPAYKIASSETTNLSLLRAVASTKKPVIISTGMCDMVDIEESVNACIDSGNNEIALLQCGAMYPLPEKLANLNVIKTLSSRFDCPIGFSDHTLGLLAGQIAVGVGATIFEKHITLNKSNPGPDHFYALTPEELKAYVENLHHAYSILGDAEKIMLPDEIKFGRRDGIYFLRDLAAGSIITLKDIMLKRPATGIRSRYVGQIIGKKISCDCKKDTPLTWEAISNESE
ncbi:N-acetylneuraminate synthase family protein [Polynucleobacter sp. AP-Sanab-80-C2]|uniref:N-acetylneuraminate synthase family protein n=1 Tax=Polynucleobacter sp. AP-Sanab-80-C2 TaxID=3108274 RepID=UPI002B22A29F|nr:N-acetylneuraminate synthase family protein [Polynucleobacter sp. AP-Sanab-80-C2]MEA9598559.1 N-acetylneuraminate synthase family protein [Polynucleobacter sp. AP-Sanab-80-C2]